MGEQLQEELELDVGKEQQGEEIGVQQQVELALEVGTE